MSAADISNIPQASTINEVEFRKAYKNIVQIIPVIVNTLNHATAKPAKKARKIEEIQAYINSNLQTLMVALQTPNNALTDITTIPVGEQ